MQSLARDGLSAAQVASILTAADSISVDKGLELLNANLDVVADISEDLAGGTISRVMDADIHGTCRLSVSRALTWGTDIVRPYMRMTDDVTGLSARFNVGAYCLVTPARDMGDSVETYDVTGYDRLYLLNRPVGQSYTIPQGTTYLTAAVAVVAAAGLPTSAVLFDGTARDKALPSDMTWPLQRPERDDTGQFLPGHGTVFMWLDVLNDLLAAIGYRNVWADENGRFRSEPNVNPAQRSVDWTFDTDQRTTIVSPRRTVTRDMWQVPNRWVFIQQNRSSDAPAPTFGPPVSDGVWARTPGGDGLYTVDNLSAGPTSQSQRGLVWASVTQLDAADQATLVQQGDAQVVNDITVTTTFKVTTGPFPAAGHGDVFAYDDDVLGLQSVQAVQWDLDLDGADMAWQWSVIA